MTAALLALALAQVKLPPVAGDRLPPFEIETASGAQFRWRPGRPTVLCFCAMWCDTWKIQLPRLSKSLKAVKGLPVECLTISVDGRWMDRANGTSFDHLLADPRGEFSTKLGIDRVPYTLVVDSSGVIRWSEQGILRSDEIARQVRAALQPPKGGAIYLTFDDFPGRSLNDRLLDVLRAKHVPATFFCIGSDAQREPEAVRRAASEEHSIQIHAWDHQRDDPQLARCAEIVKSLSGSSPTFYRAPGSERIARLSGGYLNVYADDPYDFQRPGVSELTRRILNEVRPGAVIQLHAGVTDTVNALPFVIDNLRERGYTFSLLR